MSGGATSHERPMNTHPHRRNGPKPTKALAGRSHNLTVFRLLA